MPYYTRAPGILASSLLPQILHGASIAETMTQALIVRDVLLRVIHIQMIQNGGRQVGRRDRAIGHKSRVSICAAIYLAAANAAAGQ